MSTVLTFRASVSTRKSVPSGKSRPCEIVIFPGIRIERHEEPGIDLGHRLADAADLGNFDSLGGGRMPRKTS